MRAGGEVIAAAPHTAPHTFEVPPRPLLGVLFLGTLLAALDIAVVGPALPALREAFGLDERAVAWTFTAFVLANLVGLPLMTALSDRLGRRTVYLADVALFAAGTVVVALAPSFGVLLVGRVVQGLGASGIFPVASAVIGDVYPPEKRGRALGLLGAVFGVAFLIGPALGGVMLAVASWRWLFALSLPLAAVVFVLSARALPDTRAAHPPPLDGRGLLLLSAMVGALVLGLSSRSRACCCRCSCASSAAPPPRSCGPGSWPGARCRWRAHWPWARASSRRRSCCSRATRWRPSA
jgi:multidrug resistance protein